MRGPVHPKFVPLAEPSGVGWLDGFDELLCRCGLVSNGAPEFDERGQLRYGLHGRIANLPARKVERPRRRRKGVDGPRLARQNGAMDPDIDLKVFWQPG